MGNSLQERGAAPNFDLIQEDDFPAALDLAFEDVKADYDKIRDNQEPASFENTVKPFDSLFKEVNRLFGILGVYWTNSKTNRINEIDTEYSKKWEKNSSKIFQDSKLAARFQSVYDQRDQLELDDEDLWFLEGLYKNFKNSGAFLEDTDKARLQKIDLELYDEAKKFQDNLDADQKERSFLVTDINNLKGVPEEFISAMKTAAKKAGHDLGWLFVPERLLVDDLLCVAEDRDFRRKMLHSLDKLGTEGRYSNEPVLKKIQELRHEKANLLGYKTFAEYKLSQTMAGSPERVNEFLSHAGQHLLTQFEGDIKILQSWVSAQGGPQMEPWDVPYYEAQYKQSKFGFNQSELSQYLELDNVIDGWIKHVEITKNIELEETDKYTSWNDDVRVFETYDRDTGKKGLLYMDLFARSGEKWGGAWMDCIHGSDPESGQLNSITFNMNLPKPETGKPVFMSIDQFRTFYHEGGHALHGLKGTEAKYKSQCGTGNGSDYVEIHSMLHENWCFEQDNLMNFAFHHERSDQVLPQHILDAKEQSDSFLISAAQLRVIQNALRDISFHNMAPENWGGIEDIHQDADFNNPISSLLRSYPLSRFDHLFQNAHSGYACGYYGYFWSEAAQATAYEHAKEHGAYNPDFLKRMQKFFSIGAALEPNQAYEEFTGKKAGDPTALLKQCGIDLPQKNISKKTMNKLSGPKPSGMVQNKKTASKEAVLVREVKL